MPKSAKKKKVITSPKKRTAKKKAISKVMKGGMEVDEGPGGGGARPKVVEDLISFLIESTPEEDRKQINDEHYNNLFNTIGETDDLLSQVFRDPGGGLLKRIFNLGDDFKYDKLRNFMLGGSSNITQCNQTVGKKDETILKDIPCIWCGAPLDDASECEHVLPVVAAALLLTFSGGPNPELKRIIEWLLEYGWSHQLCNQVKSNDLFITTIDLPDRRRIFVPDFDLLIRRFYNVVKSSKSKCWSPTPLTNPRLSSQVKANCTLLLHDIDSIVRINPQQIYDAVNPSKGIDGAGVALMGEKPGVYPASLFFRKVPNNTLGNLNLSESPNTNSKPEFLFPSGAPTRELHWDPDIFERIKGHPILFLINICRYLNFTKKDLLAGEKSAQQEALTRFFTGIKKSDLLQLLTNTIESVVDEAVKEAFTDKVKTILEGIEPALQLFKDTEEIKKRTLFEKVKRFSTRGGRNKDDIMKAVRKRAGKYDKEFRDFDRDLKRIKKTNTATHAAIITEFTNSSFPKSLKEFKIYLDHNIEEMFLTQTTTGGVRYKKKGGGEGGGVAGAGAGAKDEALDAFIDATFLNILPTIKCISGRVSELEELIIPESVGIAEKRFPPIIDILAGEELSSSKKLRFLELYAVINIPSEAPSEAPFDIDIDALVKIIKKLIENIPDDRVLSNHYLNLAEPTAHENLRISIISVAKEVPEAAKALTILAEALAKLAEVRREKAEALGLEPPVDSKEEIEENLNLEAALGLGPASVALKEALARQAEAETVEELARQAAAEAAEVAQRAAELGLGPASIALAEALAEALARQAEAETVEELARQAEAETVEELARQAEAKIRAEVAQRAAELGPESVAAAAELARQLEVLVRQITTLEFIKTRIDEPKDVEVLVKRAEEEVDQAQAKAKAAIKVIEAVKVELNVWFEKLAEAERVAAETRQEEEKEAWERWIGIEEASGREAEALVARRDAEKAATESVDAERRAAARAAAAVTREAREAEAEGEEGEAVEEEGAAIEGAAPAPAATATAATATAATAPPAPAPAARPAGAAAPAVEVYQDVERNNSTGANVPPPPKRPRTAPAPPPVAEEEEEAAAQAVVLRAKRKERGERGARAAEAYQDVERNNSTGANVPPPPKRPRTAPARGRGRIRKKSQKGKKSMKKKKPTKKKKNTNKN